MREIVHIQAGQCGNQIGAKVCIIAFVFLALLSVLVSLDACSLSRVDLFSSQFIHSVRRAKIFDICETAAVMVNMGLVMQAP